MKHALTALIFLAPALASADAGKCIALGRDGGEDVSCAQFDDTNQASCKAADGSAWCEWQPAAPEGPDTHSAASVADDIAIVLSNQHLIETLDGRAVTSVRRLDTKIKTYEVQAGDDCKVRIQLTPSAMIAGLPSIVPQIILPVDGCTSPVHVSQSTDVKTVPATEVSESSKLQPASDGSFLPIK